MTTDPPELHEDVDLDLQQRKRVLELYAKLDRLTYYELLGVARDADKKTVKQAHHRLAGVLHPDRYFGKRLGSYRAKLETIFTHVTFAADTLADPQRRAEYDAEVGLAPSPLATRSREDDDLERKRQAACKAAARACAAGDLVAAAESLRLACSYAPNDRALAAEHARIARELAEHSAASHARQALVEERFGHWANAAASWRRVLEKKPGDPDATARLAAALERARGR